MDTSSENYQELIRIFSSLGAKHGLHDFEYEAQRFLKFIDATHGASFDSFDIESKKRLLEGYLKSYLEPAPFRPGRDG